MERILDATEARVHFGELLRRVSDGGERVVVERGGIPQAVVMGISDYERLVAKSTAGGWRERAWAIHEVVQGELRGKHVPSPEEVLRQSREERDGQLTGLR